MNTGTVIASGIVAAIGKKSPECGDFRPNKNPMMPIVVVVLVVLLAIFGVILFTM